jgi:hypothetical protein
VGTTKVVAATDGGCEVIPAGDIAHASQKFLRDSFQSSLTAREGWCFLSSAAQAPTVIRRSAAARHAVSALKAVLPR